MATVQMVYLPVGGASYPATLAVGNVKRGDTPNTEGD